MRISLAIRRRRRAIFGLAVWGGAVGLAFWLYQSRGGTPAAVGVAESRLYRVSPALLGRLVSLEVVEGQRVRPGQVVARFETALLERELSVVEAQLEQAAAAVRAAGVEIDGAALQAARNFQSEIEAAEVELKAAQSEYARERTELRKLMDDLRKEQDLVRQGLARSDRMAALDLRRPGLEEGVKNWPRRIQALEARFRAAVDRMEAWRRTHTGGAGGTRQTQLKPLEAKVREKHESLALLRTHREQSILRAGQEAYVTLIHARPGDVVRPGDPVVTLVEVQPRQVVAYLDERRGEALPAGAKVTARRRTGSRQQWEAVVAAVAGDVSELPRRLWLNPVVPSWGRAMYVNLPEQAQVEPGELLDISVPGASPARTLMARLGWGGQAAR